MKKIRLIIGIIICFFTFQLTGCQKTVYYKIEYNLNGGTCSETLVMEFSNKEIVELTLPTKEGYTFLGWYDNPEFTGVEITTLDSSFTNDISLYANWEAIKYQINYELNGGSFNSIVSNEYTIEDNIQLVQPTRDNYIFRGWYNNESFEGSQITIIEGSSKQNIKLYAKWERLYSINYETNKGTLPVNAITSYLEGEEVILPIPTRYGYSFLGWYDKLDNQVLTIEAGTKKDVELYAKWEKLWTVNFILYDGTLEEGTYVQINGKTEYILPIPTKEKHQFLGWYTSSEFVDQIDRIEAGLNEDIIIYAMWGQIFTIEYNVNGGTMPDEYISEYLSNTETPLPIPTKQGYEFLGWSDGKSSAIFKTIPISYQEDLNLIAKWNKKIYTVRYILNDGEVFADKEQLFYSFFTDFYNYIVEYRDGISYLERYDVADINDFFAFCGAWTGGAAGMSQVGNLLGNFYLKIQRTKDVVDNLPEDPASDPELYISIIKSQLSKQTADDGFIGYCLENKMYVNFIDFLVEFFFWWRLDEGYTGGSSDPNNIGSDFFASAWASAVDTAKFFYYDIDTLPSYFIKKEHIPNLYNNIPCLMESNYVEFEYQYDWEKEIILPPTIYLQGFEFVGWYLTSDYSGEAITKIEKNIYHDIIVYGKFIKIE